jgi:VWFA-related protein
MIFFRSGLLCFCVVAAFGQAPTAEVTTKDTTVTFRSGTNLVPVSVVVRDRNGRAVGNLSIDDFQLFDNGKAQLISKFSVEKIAEETAAVMAPKTSAAPVAEGAVADANPDGIPDHFTAYLFDDLHLNVGDLARTRTAAKKQIDASMRPLSRAAIYTTSGRTTQEFTADRDKLHAALDAITANAALTEEAARNNACPPIEYYMADRIYNKHDTAVWATYANDALGCSGVGGQSDPSSKIQASDVSQCEISGSTDGPCKAIKLTKEEARFALANGDRYTEASLAMMRALVSRMTAIAGQRNIVLVSPGFLVLDDKTEEEMALIDRAIKAKVIIGGLDARGLYADIQGGDASSRTNPQTLVDKIPLQKMATIMATDVVANMADGTGGTFYQGTNDYDEAFARVASTPDYVYVLGFSPLALKTDGKFHTLKVTLKDAKGLELQVRKGYFAPTAASNPADKAKQDIEEAVFSRDEIHDLPAILQTQYFTAGDGSATLSAVAKIDVKKLSFHKEGDRNRNDLTVTTGLFDSDGNFVNGSQKVVEMRLLDDTLEKRLANGIAVKNSFAVHSGRYVVRLVVRDSEGQTMSAQSSMVEIP